MPTEQPQSPCWFVVEAREGGLDKAKLRLAVAGLTIWAPMDVKRDPTRGRHGKPRRDIRRPRFGNYFFVRAVMTETLCNAIDTTAGVLCLLRAAGTDEPAKRSA